MSLKLLYIMLNGHQLAIFLVPNYGPPKHHHAVFFWATKVWPRCPVWSWKVWMPSWNPVAKQTWQAGKSTITGSFNGNIIKLYQTTLLLFNSSPWYRWPIEIDGLPINSMVIFHGSLLNNQMVNGGFYWMVAVSLEPGTSSSQGHTSTRLARGSLHLWQLGSPKIGWQSVEKTWILNIFYGKMESSPFFMGKKTFFSGKKTTIFGMAETDGFICCGTKAGGGKGKLGTQLLSKWGTGFFGIGKSGNSFLFINRR